MGVVRGTVDLEIAGERRRLVCDMVAAEVFFQLLGEHWLLWLYDRFIGRPDRKDGQDVRVMAVASPRELGIALYALLASDRERARREETVASLMQAVGALELTEIRDAIRRAVLASAGAPGEGREAGAGAAVEPPGSPRAATPGTGTPS